MKRNNADDIQIRELLDKSLPQAPQNDWFLKKTLNRLPQKRGNTISIIEIVGYLIAIFAIITIEGLIIYNVATTGTLTLNDIVWIVSLNIALLSIVISIFSPQLRNIFQ